MISQRSRKIFSNHVPKKKHESETLGLDIISIFFRTGQEEIVESPMSGEPTYLCIGCKVHNRIQNVGLTIGIKGLAEGGDVVLLLNCLQDKRQLNFLPGEHEVQLQMPYLGLRLGTYIMDVYAKKDGLYHLDSVEFFRFTVKAKESTSRCLFNQPRSWVFVSRIEREKD